MRMSASDIAMATGLSKRAVVKRANTENWPYEITTGRGGKTRLYSAAHLPTDVRESVLKDSTTYTLPSSTSPATLPAPQFIEEKTPPPPPAETEIPRKYRQIGLARADLVEAFLMEKDYARRRPGVQVMDHLERWLADYNAGNVLRLIRAKAGRVRSIKTLYTWAAQYQAGGWPAICGYRRPHNKGHLSLSHDEKNMLKAILLHPNRPTLTEAARQVAEAMEREGRPHPSIRTYVRWCQSYRDRNAAVWTMARDGGKAFRDKNAYFISRDSSALEVGEILVADGHRLNFQIINPYTGKPARMTMVLFYDMRSRMPLGWEIMPQENIQCIHSALYNSILTLGKIPKAVILDNGKAFKAKAFTGGLRDADLTQAGIQGLYARLGIEAHFAWPYNARAKSVERFFGTLNQAERMMAGYTGRNIMDKPWLMKRNEDQLRALYPGETILTVEEANDVLARYFMQYASRSHRGLDGATPAALFSAGRGPGVNPAHLAAAMLLEDTARISNCMFSKFGIRYFAEELLHLSGLVKIRYSLTNLRAMFVFTLDDQFIAMARHDAAEHPLAKGADYESVKRKIRLQRRQEAEVRRALKAELDAGLGFLDRLMVPELDQGDNPWQLEGVDLPAVEAHFDQPARRQPEMVALAATLPEPPAAGKIVEFNRTPSPAEEPVFTNPYTRADHLADKASRQGLSREEREWLSWFKAEFPDYVDVCNAQF